MAESSKNRLFKKKKKTLHLDLLFLRPTGERKLYLKRNILINSLPYTLSGTLAPTSHGFRKNLNKLNQVNLIFTGIFKKFTPRVLAKLAY